MPIAAVTLQYRNILALAVTELSQSVHRAWQRHGRLMANSCCSDARLKIKKEKLMSAALAVCRNLASEQELIS
jgi:hypothetical protein